MDDEVSEYAKCKRCGARGILTLDFDWRSVFTNCERQCGNKGTPGETLSEVWNNWNKENSNA